MLKSIKTFGGTIPKTTLMLAASFGAMTLAGPAQAAALYLLPIQVCDNAGNNCANAGKELYLAATNKIWAQADITFTYLPFKTTNSTALLNLADNAEVQTLFNTAPGADGNQNIISVWFVASHYSAYGEVNAIGGNKLVIDDTTFSSGRIDTIAHEVGHLLGLKHDDPGVNTDFLMRSGLDRLVPGAIGDITPDGTKLDKLTAAQITLAKSDAKVGAVPEPSTWAMLIMGFAAVGGSMRHRRGVARPMQASC